MLSVSLIYCDNVDMLGHHHQLSSSVVEGRHALNVQVFQLVLFSAARLMEAYESCWVQSFISSIYIRRGIPCAILPFSLLSRICVASTPPDPRKTYPANAIFCFTNHYTVV